MWRCACCVCPSLWLLFFCLRDPTWPWCAASTRPVSPLPASPQPSISWLSAWTDTTSRYDRPTGCWRHTGRRCCWSPSGSPRSLCFLSHSWSCSGPLKKKQGRRRNPCLCPRMTLVPLWRQHGVTGPSYVLVVRAFTPAPVGITILSSKCPSSSPRWQSCCLPTPEYWGL